MSNSPTDAQHIFAQMAKSTFSCLTDLPTGDGRCQLVDFAAAPELDLP
jgi:hypothetical protein